MSCQLQVVLMLAAVVVSHFLVTPHALRANATLSRIVSRHRAGKAAHMDSAPVQPITAESVMAGIRAQAGCYDIS